jgi:hypothetical protein
MKSMRDLQLLIGMGGEVVRHVCIAGSACSGEHLDEVRENGVVCKYLGPGPVTRYLIKCLL